MSEKPVRRWQLMFDEFGDGEMVKHDKGMYIAYEDYVALERRHQDLLDAIERTGGLDNIRRVEVSQPVVIDMARENAFMKGIIMRMTEAGDALACHLVCTDLPNNLCGDLMKNWNASKPDNL